MKPTLQPASGKAKGRKGLLWVSLTAGLLCGITAGALLGLTRDLPQIEALEAYKPSAVTRVYSADGVQLAELFVERREPVSLAQIPPALITALLTTEDRAFYEHSGIALRGIARAAIKNVLTGRLSEGASTLTQQLAKTLFLTPRKSFIRKLREAVMAMQLERRYTKDELLALYLNQVYFGSGAYGVGSAARIYFNKKIEELSLAQCALIAGLLRAPSRYSPLVDPQLAQRRRDVVLAQMHSTGAIETLAYQQALQEPVAAPAPRAQNRKASYFLAYIKKDLEEAVGADLLYKGGLTIYTTLDDRLQTAAELAIGEGLEQLENRMQHNGLTNPKPEAALLALRVDSGAILGMVGGRDSSKDSFNRAATALRQPGSAFKPIVYALAIEKGFEQNHMLLDAPAVFPNTSPGDDWRPENSSESYAGEISLRWALAQSKNIPAVRLIEQLSPSSVVAFAQQLGIGATLKPNLSLALGTSEVTLLEMTAAYAVFANGGKYIQPYGVMEIRDDRGKILWRPKPEQRLAMTRISAAITTDMLRAVVTEGTGQTARRLPGPIAGKTGTTSGFKDALFVGYSPTIAAGVWVGNEDASTLGPQETGTRTALPIWTAFMQSALADQPPAYFDIPDDVRAIYINSQSGAQMPTDAAGAVKVLVR
ncbi:MAG: PBP1A family penicillin-binding protein [Desulfatitalea sp.]|nr:PBP1A family penicillin-binding protein [Desulfatitalea sp.]MBI5896751.1 PBP1A family penicillin-binding protein [Desulfobacterales bacterium]